jgi:CHAT domain-containing protein
MRHANRRWIWILLALASFSSTYFAQTPAVWNELLPGKSIARELAAGEVHDHSIQLTTGQFVSLVVEQHGIDVLVTLYDPDGKRIAGGDSLSYFKVAAPVPVTIVTNAGGNYRLEIRSLKVNVSAGSYEVEVAELRAATQQDILRASARQAFAEGWHLHSRDWAEPIKARQKFEAALTLFRSAGDERGAAQTLTELGWIQTLQGQQLPKAIDYYNEALPLFRANKDLSGEALALCGIGWSYHDQGEPQKALDYNQRAVVLYQAAGDRRGEAFALNRLGKLHAAMFEMLTARGIYEQARSVFRLVGDRRGEGRTNYLVGTTYEWSGEKQQALDTYWQAQTLLRSVGDPLGEASTFYNIAEVYRGWGELQKAVDYYAQGFEIFDNGLREAGKPMAPPCYREIGDLYAEMGERKKAVACYTQLLSFYRMLSEANKGYGTQLDEGELFTRIGIQYFSLNDPQKARELLLQAADYLIQRLPHWKAVGGEWEAAALSRIGSAYRWAGDYRRALDYSLQSLALYQARDLRHTQTFLLDEIGFIYASLGELAPAIDYYNQELQLRRATREHAGEARTLYEIARLELRRDNLAGARQQIEAALDIIESLRTQIANQQSRTSYFTEAQRYYEFYVSLLMQLNAQHPSKGYDAMALQASERARARSLLEALTEARADIRQGVDLELLKREGATQRRLNAAAEQETRLLTGTPDEPRLVAIKKEVDAATAELQEIEQQIRLKSPRYSALTKPVPLTLNEIQKDVLDAETALLEYSLGEAHSYLFMVTPTSIKTVELPKRSELESSVRRSVALLSDGQRWTTNRPEFSAEYAKAAAQLSRILLPPALMSQLNVKRLVIVGDGALHYLPFSTLVSPKLQVEDSKSGREQKGAGSGRPLIADYELISLPSASTLAVLRRETLNRPPGAKSVAVLADPVFEDTDERVKKAPLESGAAGAGLPKTEVLDGTNLRDLSNSRSLLERALRFDSSVEGAGPRRKLSIARLPFTRVEAQGILASAPVSESLSATDFRANRETATGAELAQYRFVHFATHGILNSEHPELSGIVLSLVNEQGQPVDGFLRLHEIYNLNLPADLVVLSACQTGLGKEIRGEGLVGLTRGFMYAGAPRVLASLWKVDDAATAELMKRFYRGMLKENLRPAAALRAAKVEMWKQKRWQAPFYWAAFELQGEWK